MYAIEVVSTEIFVVALALLQVVANDYKAVCHCDDRPLAATSGRHSPELRRQVGVLGSRCSPGTLTCHATQPRTTFARCTAQALPSAFVITRAQGSPTRQLFSRRKLRHVVTHRATACDSSGRSRPMSSKRSSSNSISCSTKRN